MQSSQKTSNKIFLLFGSVSLSFLLFVVVFHKVPSDHLVLSSGNIIKDSASVESIRNSDPAEITSELQVQDEVEVPYISPEQYRMVKQIVLAADPSLAEIQDLDSIIADPMFAQSVASLIDEVESSGIETTAVKGAMSSSADLTGEDCEEGAFVIKGDPACFETEVKTTIDDDSPHVIGSGCRDGDPNTPCIIRGSSHVEIYKILAPKSVAEAKQAGIWVGTQPNKKYPEESSILIANGQINELSMRYQTPYVSSLSGRFGSPELADKYEDFRQGNSGTGTSSPSNAMKLNEYPNGAYQNFSLGACPSGQEVCEEVDKTNATFPGTDTKGNDISPAKTTMNSNPDALGYSISSPGSKPLEAPKSECINSSKEEFIYVKNVEEVCKSRRASSLIGFGVRKFVDDIRCKNNPNLEDCQVQFVTGIQIDSMFGDTEDCIEGMSCANSYSQSIVGAYTSPSSETIISTVATPCQLRIDYSLIVDVFCYFQDQSIMAEFTRNQAGNQPGKAVDPKKYIKALEEQF